MSDPSLGRDRATRSLGEFASGIDHPISRKPMKKVRSGVMDVKAEKNKKTRQNNPTNEERNVNNGQFGGVRPTYGRYQVSERSADILNRSLRSMNKEY